MTMVLKKKEEIFDSVPKRAWSNDWPQNQLSQPENPNETVHCCAFQFVWGPIRDTHTTVYCPKSVVLGPVLYKSTNVMKNMTHTTDQNNTLCTSQTRPRNNWKEWRWTASPSFPSCKSQFCGRLLLQHVLSHYQQQTGKLQWFQEREGNLNFIVSSTISRHCSPSSQIGSL